MTGAARFERGEGGAGALVRHIENVTAADLLARMWTLFGPPDEVADGGFRYEIRDRDTGQLFEVYSGASGPAYGGPLVGGERLEPVLAALDAVLAQTVLADCEIEIPIGDSKLVLGASKGVPFERHEQPAAPTRDQAIARAEQTLAADHPDPATYYLAMLKLAEAFPDTRAVLAKLWQRSFATAIARIETELASPAGPYAGTVRRMLEAIDRLRDEAGVDVAAACAPHEATLEAARAQLSRAK